MKLFCVTAMAVIWNIKYYGIAAIAVIFSMLLNNRGH